MFVDTEVIACSETVLDKRIMLLFLNYNKFEFRISLMYRADFTRYHI